MKNKLIYTAAALVLSLIAMQSCEKEPSTTNTVWEAAMPSAPTPAPDQVIAFTGANQSINLTWTGTATNAIKWDVYFGTGKSPKHVASDVTTSSYTAQVKKGGTYYWQVSTIDANGVESWSPVWSFQVNSNPDAAATPVPALDSLGAPCLPRIAWSCADPEGDALTYDLYLGTSNDLKTVSVAGIEDTLYTVTSALDPNTDYYWKVVAHDPYGGKSESPVWKFTTADPNTIIEYIGDYNVDEPAEAYNYDVAFSMKDAGTITIDNYWNSGWEVDYIVDLAKLTYSFPVTTFARNWTGTESGYIDPATGTMVGTYTIWYKGEVAEQGVHTYKKF